MPFPTPQEVSAKATAEARAEADKFRPIVEKKLNASKGGRFVLQVGSEMPENSEAAEILAAELRLAKWDVKRHSPWDGTFYECLPTGLIRAQ
jgi:hypothetical protein